MMPDLNQIQQGKAILKGWNKFGKKNIKNIEQHWNNHEGDAKPTSKSKSFHNDNAILKN